MITFFLFSVPLNAQARTVCVGVFKAKPMAQMEKGGPEGLFIDLLRYFAVAPILDDPESYYSRSFKKWTSFHRLPEIPSCIKWGIIILIASGFSLGIWGITLKRQIEQKTRTLEAEISERKRMEKKLKKSLFEKETLIRELYHRTRNTMQTIRGMLLIQAEDFETNEEFQLLIKNTDSRIQAMSLVHQMLYDSDDLSRISIKRYTEELSVLILQSFSMPGGRITIDIRADDHYFLLDTAIPFGLILNELMTNSLKYAFPDNREGVISIDIQHNEKNKTTLHYSDNGIGVPEGFDFRKQSTLGVKLIFDIGEIQMRGRVIFDCKDGVHCTLEIPSDLYMERI